MSKRGVLWGLGGLLGVAVVTLCVLLVTTTGASFQSSVEPQVTNLPTGEASDYEIAESPEVEQRAPSYQTPFQPNDRPSVALGPLPSESPPQASFAASSSPVARGANDLITATITASDTAEGDTVTVTIGLSSPLPSGLADDALQLVVRNKNRRADFGALDENGTLNLVELFGDGTTTVVLLPVVDDMIFEVQEQGRLTVEGSPELDSQFTKITSSSDIYAEVRFQIIDNETVRIVPRAPVTGDYGPEITTVMEFGVFEVFAELAPGVTADRDVTVEFEYKFDSTDENGNVRTPLRCEEISLCDPHTPNSLKRQVTIMEGETRSSRRTNIGILQDMIAEETKLFQLVPTRTVPETTFDSTPIHITVLDNDTLTYEIRGADEIDENAGSYTVQLRRKGTITADATVTYTVSGGDSSPASEADFPGSAFPMGEFTFSGYDALSDEVSIMIENDGVSEITETFKISVAGGTSTPKEVAIIDDDQSGMPPVTDNDDPQPELDVVTATVSLSATSWYEDDDDALVVTFELADGVTVANDVTIDYELEFPTIDTDGNRRMAADVTDFVGATTGTVLIPAGASSVNLEIASSRPGGYRYLGFNARGGRGPFVNVAFRQAVATLIDTEQIVRDVLQGVVNPIYSVVPASNGFWHNPDLPRFGSGSDREARINEAVRILAAGGYTWTVAPSWDAINGRVIDGEGFKDSTGQEVRTFKILSVEKSFDPFRFEAANLIARWLNEAGIPTEVTTSSIGTIVGKIRNYDAWILGWNTIPYPRHLVDTFTTDDFSASPDNFGFWINDEYNRLAANFPINEPTDTMELARVRELAFQLQAILAHELPYVVLFPNPPATGGLAFADDSVSEEPELVGIRLTGARIVSGATLMVADEPAIITILDNDAVEYVIEGAETVAEEDGVYVARLRRRGYTLSDASVDYTIIGLGPNAVDHNDFVNGVQLPTGAVTFVGHDAVTFVGHDTLSSEIRIPLMDDAVSEGRETFRIVVARGVSTLPATRDVTLWDADASRPVISLDPITDLTEGENLTITARLSSIAMNDVMLSLTVSSTLLSDAYPDSADYTISSPQTISAGDLTTMFILETVDDTIYEGIEFGKLVLTIITPGADVDAGNVERTFRLTDNDPVPVVSLDPVPARITEVENLTVTVRLSNPTNVDVTLALAVFGDVDRGDYELATPTVTIPAGESVATFNLNTVDYVLPEEDEQVELSLILISPEIGIGLGEVYRTFTLVDNDQVPIVSLDPVVARLDEGQSLMVTARLSRVVDFDTTLSLSVAGDVDQDDYTLSMPTVTIPKGQMVATFTLGTTPDAAAEADELVELSLGIVSPATGVGIGVGGAVRTFTLVDSGPAPLASLDPVSPQVKEGEALMITVRLSTPAKVDTTLGLVVSGAVDQDDYTLSTPTVTIRAGASVATFNLNTIPDTVYEGDEQVELSLIVSPAGSARVGGETRTFILEENGPVPTVSLDSVRPEITEGDNAALVITFKLPDGVTAVNDITVDYELEFPTSDAAGNRRMAADATDFVGATTGTVLIEAGKSGADLEIANGPPGGYRYLGFNTQREQFNDVAFRQAVATLIDTDFIAQSVLGGVVSPIYSVVSESNGFWHNPNVPRFGSGLDREARINEAVRILTAAGYTWTKEPSWDETNSRVIAGEGFGDSAGSFTTTFEIVSVTESDDPFRFAAANLIEEWLDEAGIPTTVTTADLFAISDMIPSFDAWILGWDIETLYPESPLRVTFADGERLNYGSWVNAEYERLIAQLPTDEPTAAMDLAHARELAFQLQAILARELPYVLLFPNPPATEDLALVDDKVSEEPELVGIRLTGARVVSGETLMVDDDPAIITILDNDAVEYVIEGAETVVEGGVYSARLRRRGYTLSDDSVAYTVVGLGPDAADAADFSGAVLPTGEFTFVGHDALSAEIRIPLREDPVAEDPETFRIEVASGVSTLPATRDVTIRDNDAPEVTLSLTEGSTSVITELDSTSSSLGILNIRQLMVDGLVGTLEMELGLAARAATVNDGGTAADVYFFKRIGGIEEITSITLVPGQTNLDLFVVAAADDVVEFDETVNLYIATVNGVRVTDSGVDITIKNKGKAQATLTVEDGAEGGTTMATIDLGGKTLSSAIPSNALRLVLADGSTMNADVEIVATDIVAGLKEASTVNVPIILKDDGMVEDTERVDLELRIDSTIAPGLGTLLTVGTGSSFMLADAEMDQVSIAALSRTSYNEGEGVTVTVGLPSGFTASADITVGYKLIVTTTDEVGKASDADIDGPVMGSVTINQDDRTAIITINLKDNDGAELMEQLGLRLTSASGTPGITFDTTTIQLTILDTDPTEYTLEGAATVVEGGTYMVRLRRVGGLITPDATVSYTVSDAATGNDVDAADFGGTFPTGSFTFSGDDALSDEISIATGDDQTLENDETFQISAGGATKDVTITDDDMDQVSIAALSRTSYNEGEDVLVTVELASRISAGTNITVGYELIVTTTDEVGKASAADITGLTSGFVTINDGARTAIITINLEDDRIIEETELLGVRLTSASGATGVTFDATTTQLMILDNEPIIGFRPEVREVDESDGEVVLTVEVISGILTEEVTLSYTTEDGSATSSGDYTGANVVSIPALSAMTQSVTFRVMIVDDMAPESTEQFFVDLAGTLPAGVTLVPSRATVTITDTDTDPVVIGFDSASYRVAENAGSVALTVKLLSGSLTETVTVSYATMDGSARAGSDYTTMMSTLTLSPGDPEETIMVPIIDDDTRETDEMFTVELSVGSSGVILDPSVATVTIPENDQPIVVVPEIVTATLSLENITVPEDETRTFEILLSDIAPEALTFTLVGDSAYTGDYTLSPDPIVISKGGDRVTVTIMAVDDPAAELDEVFMLSLMSESSLVMIGDRDSITVTIPGNDQPVIPPDPEPDPVEIGFSLEAYKVDENAGSVMLTVEVISGTLTEDVMLTYMTSDGSAVAGSDYMSMFGILTLSPGDTEETIMVQIIDDSTNEPDETFMVHLFLSGTSAGITLDPDVATVTIIDDDLPPPPEAAEVEFVVTSATIDEGDKYEIGLRLVDDAGDPLSYSQDVQVKLEVVSVGTTLMLNEYMFSSTVTIPAGDTMGVAPFYSIEDTIVEYDEKVVLRISGVVTSGTNPPRTNSDMLTITVRDDDAEIGFDSTSYSVNEDAGTVVLTVKLLSGTLTETVVVSYETMDGSASAGSDYTNMSGVLTLSPGDTEETIMVPIVNDDLFENDEMFTVVLSGTPAGVTLDPDVATVTIKDNDTRAPVVIGFRPYTYTVVENAGSVTLTVAVISGMLTENVILNYMTSDGSAVASSDYTLTTGPLTLSPGDTEKTIVVPIVNDDLFENDEMFTVRLLLSGTPAGVTLDPAIATVTITDNEDSPNVSFTMASSTIAENAANPRHEIGLTLNGALAEDDITVTFMVTGSATRGANLDYTLTATTVTIPAMMRDATIRLDVNNDDLYDGRPHETVVLSLVSATGGVTVDATKDDHTVTITDDEDAPTVTLSPATPSVTEGERAVFTVTLSHGVDEAVTLELAVSNGSAGADDYARSDSETQLSVTIGAGETTGELSLKTNKDSLYEGDETVMLNLSATSGGENVMGLPINRELTITEFSDRPTLLLSGPSTVSENDASVVIQGDVVWRSSGCRFGSGACGCWWRCRGRRLYSVPST